MTQAWHTEDKPLAVKRSRPREDSFPADDESDTVKGTLLFYTSNCAI